MGKCDRFARSLLVRMKEIDPSKGTNQDESPSYEHYTLLWDAILDEIKEYAPRTFAAVERVSPWDWRV